MGVDAQIIHLKCLSPYLGSGSWRAVGPGLQLGPQSSLLLPTSQVLTHESASQSETLNDVSLFYIIKAVIKVFFLNFLFSDDVK